MVEAEERSIGYQPALDGLRIGMITDVHQQFDGRPIRDEYLIVDGGKLAGAGAHSYSAGDATGGSEEAARFGAR